MVWVYRSKAAEGFSAFNVGIVEIIYTLLCLLRVSHLIETLINKCQIFIVLNRSNHLKRI